MTIQELHVQADELQKQLNVPTEKIANCKEALVIFSHNGKKYWYYKPTGVMFSMG